MPKVSIVLPTYNGEKYLRESIDSIIGQTFSDWELIIVNDCSTDNTQNIIDEYVDRDNRIKCIINKTNQKLPESLNIGFRKAKGEYLTWTSDDNMYLPSALECMNAFLDINNETYMVCTGMDVIDENGIFLHKQPQYDAQKMLFDDYVGACFMYRNCILQTIGEYNTEKFLVEDYDYWLRILHYYGKIEYIDEILYQYRLHKNSLTGERAKDIHRQLLKLRKENLSYIMEGVKEKKYLWFLYYSFKFEDFMDEYIYKAFLQVLPEIQHEVSIDNSQKLVIYGAGVFGNKAYQNWKDRIVYYVDKDEEKVGKKINGIDVLSIEHLSELQKKYLIVVASDPQFISSFIEVLEKYKVGAFAVYCP